MLLRGCVPVYMTALCPSSIGNAAIDKILERTSGLLLLDNHENNAGASNEDDSNGRHKQVPRYA
jgi:hypothetical protein